MNVVSQPGQPLQLGDGEFSLLQTYGAGSTPVGTNYTAEDGTTLYVAEDGSTFYVQE